MSWENLGRLVPNCDSNGPPGSLNRSSSEINSPTIVVRKFGSMARTVRMAASQVSEQLELFKTNIRDNSFEIIGIICLTGLIRDTVGFVVCHALCILKQGFGSLLSFKLETGYSLKLP